MRYSIVQFFFVPKAEGVGVCGGVWASSAVLCGCSFVCVSSVTESEVGESEL